MLIAEPVVLTVDLNSLISHPGVRAVCSVCEEEIINERQVQCAGDILCRACAGEAYYAAASLTASDLGVRALAVQARFDPAP